MIQILKNSIDIFAARAINALSQLGIVVLISRRLGPDTFGEFSFLNAVVLTGIVVANFGLDTYMVREVSRDQARGNRLIWTTIKFKLLSSGMVILAVFILFRYVFNTFEISNLLTLFSVTICLNALSQSLWFYSDAFNKFKVHAFLWATSNFIKLIFVWLLLSIKTGLGMVIWAAILSEIITLMLSYGTARRKFQIQPMNIPLHELRVLLKKSYPIAIIFILSAFYFRIDFIMLKLLTTIKAVGFYAASFRIVEFISIIPGTIYIAAFPNLSKNYIHDQHAFYAGTLKTLLFIGTIAMMVAVLVYFKSPVIIRTLYGPFYTESVNCLRILSFTIFLLFFNGYFAYFHLAMDNEKFVVWVLFTATCVRVLANYFLIPTYGYMGPAFSGLFTEFFMLVLYCFTFIKVGYLRFNILSRTDFGKKTDCHTSRNL